MTTQGTFTVTVEAPPETVWPWVAEVERHGSWSPRPFLVERLAGEPDTVGARYRTVGWVPGDKDHHNEVEVTEVVPQQRFALRADDPMGAFENTYDLRAVPGGTEVTYRLVFPPLKGMAAVMVPVLFPLVGKKDIRKRMALLKQKVETGS